MRPTKHVKELALILATKSKGVQQDIGVDGLFELFKQSLAASMSAWK